MEKMNDTQTNDTRYYSYSWHQSHDQATVLLMVPYGIVEEDMSVIIERNYLIAGVRGQSPIIKGRLYGNVDMTSSVWQLEPLPSRRSPRERTTSTASTASTQSSYAFVSDPEISSSFAASLDASDAEDFSISSPAPSSPSVSSGDERSFPFRSKRSSTAASRAVSPGHGHVIQSIASSYSSLESLRAIPTGRLLTLHLEKDQSIIWPSLIVGPVPDTLAPHVHNSVIFDASQELEHQYNMDATSLILIAMERFDVHKDKEEAFEFFMRAWHLSHAPAATMKLASHYLPLSSKIDPRDLSAKKPAARGTIAYCIQCLGGKRGLAQLYLEAGMLHLDGAASTLLSSSYSSLSSIRIPASSPLADGSSAWQRDREAAGRYFDYARELAPELDVPVLPPHSPHVGDELEMPSIELQIETIVPSTEALRRRRRKEARAMLNDTSKGEDMDTWYVYLPGIIGAGTALVVVGVIGALGFSWSRGRNQSG